MLAMVTINCSALQRKNSLNVYPIFKPELELSKNLINELSQGDLNNSVVNYYSKRLRNITLFCKALSPFK